MKSSTYNPHPSTIPYRVIKHLQSLPAGAEIASTPLAEAIDIMASSLSPSLMVALKHGLVKCEKREGLMYWRLGDGVPQEPSSDGPVRRWNQTPEQDPRVRFTAPLKEQADPKPAPKSVARTPAVPQAPAPKPEPAGGVDMDRVHQRAAPAPEPEPPLSLTEAELLEHMDAPTPAPEPAHIATRVAEIPTPVDEIEAAGRPLSSPEPARPVDAEEAPNAGFKSNFIFSWRSDGVFALRKGDQTIILDPDEAAALRRFLSHMRDFPAWVDC